MKNTNSQQHGFTLIEIIMVLVLVGILGSIGTFGLTTFIKNFNLSKQGTDTASKAQMALLRITKELIALTKTYESGTDGDEIKFETKHSGSYPIFRFHKSGSNLYLTEYSTSDNTTITRGPDILTDEVSSFSLQYYDWNTGANTLDSPGTSWTGPTTASCGTSVTYTFDDNGDRECDDDDNKNRQKIHFTASAVGSYVVYYGNSEYYTCTKVSDGSTYYQASDDATSTSNCEANGWKERIEDNLPYYDNDGDINDEAKFWIYPAGEPECAQEFTLYQESGDECNNLADAADNVMPAPGNTPPLTRLIEVSLTMEGINDPFIISVYPRNLPQVE